MQISGVVQVPSNNNRLKLTNQRRKAEDMLTNDEEGNKSHFVHNPNIERESPDYLYHLGLDTVTTDMVKTFSDVKFVVLGGSVTRMESFACHVARELGVTGADGEPPVNLSKATDRYVLFKAGSVLIANHGIGVNSLSVVMNELLKLLYHASATDVTFFRIGTCGGLGLAPGTVVITEEALDGAFNPTLDMIVLGKRELKPAVLDPVLTSRLLAVAEPNDGFLTVSGKTMCAADFYEGQARLDGAFCSYTEADKMEFLRRAYERGVRNIEMESLGFAAMCHQADIRGAVVCVTLVDRFQSDQVTCNKSDYVSWNHRPGNLVIKYIKQQLANSC